MAVALYTVVGFLVGCIPFAFWLGSRVLKVDIRDYGADKNPGGINAWRAGGWRVGLPGGVLDYSKGLVPVVLAQYASGLSSWALVPIAVAPVFGHAFSPLLRFRGGKAIGASFGVWTGLTQGLGFLAFGLTNGLFRVIHMADAWATVLGLFGLLAYLLIFAPQPHLLAIWAVDGAIVVWKMRHELGLLVSSRSLGLTRRLR